MVIFPSYYGILITLGLVFAIGFSRRYVQRTRGDLNTFWDALLGLVISGVLGARAYHVIHLLPYYAEDWTRIFDLRNGGLGIIGAVAGCFLFIYFFTRHRGLKLLYWTDAFTLSAPLAQAIGRWGNFVNSENYGIPTNGPLGVFIPAHLRSRRYANSEYFHPLFFYESALNLALFLVLVFISSKYPQKSGAITAVYVCGYSLIRFFLEFWKADPWVFGNLPVASIVCAAGFLAGLKLLLNLRKN